MVQFMKVLGEEAHQGLFGVWPTQNLEIDLFT